MSNAQSVDVFAQSSIPGERLLSRREVELKTSLKKSTIYALPDFPRPLRITARRSAWRASEVQAWINSRVRAGGVA